MTEKILRMFFRYNGEELSLIDIYKRNKKHKGRSRYLLSVDVEVIKDGEAIPVRVVCVCNRNKCKDYLCLITTDTSLCEEEMIRLYGRR